MIILFSISLFGSIIDLAIDRTASYVPKIYMSCSTISFLNNLSKVSVFGH
jgi:hypothetical protein